MVFEGYCFDKTMMQDSKDQIVDAMGGRGDGEKLACGKRGEDGYENLQMLEMSCILVAFH